MLARRPAGLHQHPGESRVQGHRGEAELQATQQLLHALGGITFGQVHAQALADALSARGVGVDGVEARAMASSSAEPLAPASRAYGQLGAT